MTAPLSRAAEQEVIQRTWQRISEDYAPFEVDVTTQDPGANAISRTDNADTTYGTRLVVTPTNNIYSGCGCGGIAYVGSFDRAYDHGTYQPAFVFTQGTGSSDKAIAEAGSHEIGHNLGLSHDGVNATETTTAQGYYAGHGVWAPLMGVGYSKPLTQWAINDYSNTSQSQDDVAVIAQNGALQKADDHGDANATATAIGGSTTLTATGLIGSRSDVDTFSFTAGAGSLTIAASPAPLSPNLDISLTLRNSAGATIASADPAATYVSSSVANGLSASLSATVSAGTYYLTTQSSICLTKRNNACDDPFESKIRISPERKHARQVTSGVMNRLLLSQENRRTHTL